MPASVPAGGRLISSWLRHLDRCGPLRIEGGEVVGHRVVLCHLEPTFEQAAAKRRDLVRRLHAEGVGPAELARLAGITRAAIYKIIT